MKRIAAVVALLVAALAWRPTRDRLVDVLTKTTGTWVGSPRS